MSILMNLRKSALVHPALTPMWICTLPSAPSNHKTSWPQGLFYPPLMFPRHDFPCLCQPACPLPYLEKKIVLPVLTLPSIRSSPSFLHRLHVLRQDRNDGWLKSRPDDTISLLTRQIVASTWIFTLRMLHSHVSQHMQHFFSPSTNYEEGYGDQISNNR